MPGCEDKSGLSDLHQIPDLYSLSHMNSGLTFHPQQQHFLGDTQNSGLAQAASSSCLGATTAPQLCLLSIVPLAGMSAAGYQCPCVIFRQVCLCVEEPVMALHLCQGAPHSIYLVLSSKTANHCQLCVLACLL